MERDSARPVADPEGLRRDLLAANPAWPPGEAERRVADLADCDGRAIADAVRPGVAFDLPALLAAARLPVLMLLADDARGSHPPRRDRTPPPRRARPPPPPQWGRRPPPGGAPPTGPRPTPPRGAPPGPPPPPTPGPG